MGRTILLDVGKIVFFFKKRILEDCTIRVDHGGENYISEF